MEQPNGDDVTAFTVIPGAWFDPFELTCSLRERMGGFGEAKRGRRIFNVGLPVTNWASLNWPELSNMLGRIERFGEATFQPLSEAPRLYMEMLDPGAIMQWRTREDEIARETVRFYMLLTGNPLVFFYSPGQMFQPVPGQLFACNTTIPHSAANFGETPRIALVIDARPLESRKQNVA